MSRRPPRRFRGPIGRRKSHPSNSDSTLARSRKNRLWKGLGLDDLVASPSRNQNRRQASRYSKYGLIPSSTEPLEEVCVSVQGSNYLLTLAELCGT